MKTDLAEIASALSELSKRIAKLEGKRSRGIWAKRSAALQEAGAQVWEYLFNEKMPLTIRFYWCPHLGKKYAARAEVGAIHSGGGAWFDWSYLSKIDYPVYYLVHELAHSRGFENHAKDFKRAVNRWLKKLGLPSENELRRMPGAIHWAANTARSTNSEQRLSNA